MGLCRSGISKIAVGDGSGGKDSPDTVLPASSTCRRGKNADGRPPLHGMGITETAVSATSTPHVREGIGSLRKRDTDANY